VLLALVAMCAGVVAHVSAEGLLPGPAALAGIFLVVVVAAAMFLGRPASGLRVVLLLVGGQTFVHASLTGLRGHRGEPPLSDTPAPAVLPATPSGGGRRVGSLLDQYHASAPTIPHTGDGIPGPVQHLVADMTGQHAVMALAHLVAAVAVGLWLARGERALWTVLALTLNLAGQLLEAAAAGWATAALSHFVGTGMKPHLRECAWNHVVPRRAGRILSRTLRRRGPPAPVAA
jgi:hypothetical protein